MRKQFSFADPRRSFEKICTHDGLLSVLPVFPVSSEGSSGLNASTGKNPESASRDTKIGLRTKYPRHYVL